MAPRKFDRYMVMIGAGRHLKFRKLTDSERCAHFLGVLSIAAASPLRGYLLIGEEAADADDVAYEADVSASQARGAMQKLKEKGVLKYDEDVRAWFVHDWGDLNPEPKKDPTAAQRQREYRERRRAARNGDVTHA